MTTNTDTTTRDRVQPPVAPLAALRRSHGLTFPQLIARIEERTGHTYTKGALSGLENGHRGASTQLLEDVAAAYGLTVDDLWVAYAPRAARVAS